MPKFRPWTPEEHAWALECASAGDSFGEIGEALDCPDFHEMWARLGVKRPMTATELELASLYAGGGSLEKIGRQVLPSATSPRQSAHNRIKRLRSLGYDLPPRGTFHRPFSPEERARRAANRAAYQSAQERNAALTPLIGTGPSAAEIARRFGCSRNAVLGVSYRIRKARAREQADLNQQAAHG